MTTKEVKRNVVELAKTTLNDYMYVKIVSHDETTEKVVTRAKELLKEMEGKENGNHSS